MKNIYADAKIKKLLKNILKIYIINIIFLNVL